MRIIATPVKGKDLKPGDLFSMADQTYWDHYSSYSVGEKVYIRTSAPLLPGRAEEDVNRITIEA